MPDNPADGAEAQEPSKKGLKPAESAQPEAPVIGMDGKTPDGSMPYEILKDKLEWLR